MPLHLIKLAVGVEDVEQMAPLQARRRNARGNFQHRTRMMPTRAKEVLDGGSLYWVVKGVIQVRQPIVALHRKTDDSGKKYCIIELEPRHVLVAPTSRRPFQGWRYLEARDAPPDLAGRGRGAAYVDPDMPKELRSELKKLGLL
jgi:hypothetical protein